MAGKVTPWEKIGDDPALGLDTSDPSFEAPQSPFEELDPMDVGAYTSRLVGMMEGVQWSPSMLMGGTDTIMSVSVSPEQRLMMGASAADQWLAGIYGADVTPWLEAARITDPAARAAQYEALRGMTGASAPTFQTRPGVRSAANATGATEYLNPVTGEWGTDIPELSAEAVSTAGTSTLVQRSAALAVFLAGVETVQDADGNITSSYNYDEILDPGLLQQAKDAIVNGVTPRSGIQDLLAKGPLAVAEFKGGILKVERGSNTYEMSEEFAKAHPVKAMALSKFIEEHAGPEAEVRIGGQGFVHPAAEMLGRPIDFVSGAPALAYKYAARGFGEIGELTLGDRDRYGAIADQMRGDLLKPGVVPPEDRQEYMEDIERFEDWAVGGNIMNEGESLEEDFHDAFKPENAGLGLAQMSADGIGLLPGDDLYTPWVATVGLIHNFSMADPLGWTGALRQGANLAKNIPVGSISGVARKAASSTGMKGFVDGGGTASRYLSDTQWVRVASADPNVSAEVNAARLGRLTSVAETTATQRGYDVVQVTNADGTTDVMILGMTSEEGLALARGMGQDSFRTADGIIHGDRTITPVDWGRADSVTDIHATDTDVMHLPDAALASRMDVPDAAARIKPAPPKVSQNWLIQKAFEAKAKTPDELLYSERTYGVAGSIFKQVDDARKLGTAESKAAGAVSRDALRKAAAKKALDVLTTWAPAYDPGVLRALADARSADEVHQVLVAAMVGGIRDPFSLDKILTRQADIAKRLGEIDSELTGFERLAQQIAEFGTGWKMDASGLSAAQEALSTNVVFRRAVRDYKAFQKKAKALDSERIDLLGERYHNQSVMDLDEITLPIRQLPTDKVLEELNTVVKAAERDPVEEILVALSREALGKDDLMLKLDELLVRRNVNPRQAKRIKKRAEAAANGRAREVFRAWTKVNTRMTGGLELRMPVPGHGIPENQLADYTTKTMEAVRDRARLFGLQGADVADLLGAYLRITNREDWFRFVKKLYEDIADKSPYLDARGRREMRQTHQDLLDERGGGYLVTKDADGVVSREHTLSRVINDPDTGAKLQSGVPAFSGDWLDVMRLPSNELDMQYLSSVRRWTSRSIQAGGKAGAAAQALMGVRDVVNATTYVWKSAVLIGKMPFSLLSRIQGEQAWRMAALDYASSVNHPLEWMRAVLSKGDYARFKDSHADMLGTLVDNYNEAHSFGKSVRVHRRGRQTLSPVDGERYYSALSVMLQRRFRSAEVTYYLDHSPEEIVAWLRGNESGALGDGILDNFLGARAATDLDEEEYLLGVVGRAKQELDDLVGGSLDVKATLRRGSSPGNTKDRVLNEGIQDMNVEELRARLQYGTGRAERTPGQRAELRTSLAKGYDPNVRRITVWYDPATRRVLVPEGHHTIDTLAQMKKKKIEVEVVHVDSSTIEGQGSMSPPTNPASTIVDKTKPSLGVGTRELGTWLKGEVDAGRYTPPQFLNAKAAEYAGVDVTSLASKFRDWAFQNFYSKPDVYLSRGAMFRQVAAREFDRLTELGWSEKRATQAATAHGARTTADWMYDLAARTSAQYFLRNAMPFFPAFQELGGVWLARLPMKQGGGGALGWAAGASYFGHKIDSLHAYFEDLGLIEKDGSGDYVFGLPGLDAVYGWLTGEDDAKLRFRAESIIGMLPLPGVSNMMPGLGPWPSSVLGLLARHNDVIADITNIVLPYGNDVAVGPASVNHLFHAAGVVPPWEYMTYDTQRLFMDMSIEDAMRSVVMDVEPYQESWTAEKKQAWSEDVLNRAEKRSTVHYLTRALFSMGSPAAVSITSGYEEEMSKIWQFVEGYREGTGDSAASPLIEAFKNKYPGAVWYSNGKTISHAAERTGDDFDEWIKDWREGKITTWSPKEFISWNLGMTQYWNTVGRASSGTEGQNASQILSNGFTRKDVSSEAWGQFEMYLSANPTFDAQFTEFQQARDERQGGVSMTAVQDQLLKTKRYLQTVDESFTTNGVRDADYVRVIGKLGSTIEYIATKTGSPVWEDVDWWYKTVGTPASTAMSELYDMAFALPKPEQGPLFEQIRQLKNSLDAVQHAGQTFPAPEQVWWGNKSTEEQYRKSLEWASSPLEWLSEFERGMAGFGGGGEVDALMTRINRDQQQLDQFAAENYLSTSSSEYQTLKQNMLVSQATYANENGLFETWMLTQSAPYERVLASGGHQDNETFVAIGALVAQTKAGVEAAGYSINGTTETSRRAQAYVFEQIDLGRRQDEGFNDLMTEFEYVMASPGRERAVGYEMYFKLFFDYFGSTPSINYQYDYAA